MATLAASTAPRQEVCGAFVVTKLGTRGHKSGMRALASVEVWLC